MHRLFVAASIVIATIALAGCGDGEHSEKDAPSVAPSADACTPDPELIASKMACQSDDHCPCGTHCHLGVCQATCLNDQDCQDARVCDDYGRCTIPSDSPKVRLPSRVPEGYLAPANSRVVLADGVEQPLVFHARRFDVTEARIEGRRGVEVRCDEGSDYAAECFVEDVDVDTPVQVTVRRVGSSDDGQETAELVAHGHAQTTHVNLPRPAEPPATAGGEEHPVEGRYTGRMRLIGAGSDGLLPDLPAPPTPMEQTVEAKIWSVGDTQAVLAIADRRGALTSRDEFIGRLSLSEPGDDGVVSGSASFPNHPFVQTQVAGRATEMLAEMVDASFQVDAARGRLTLELTERFIGTGSAIAPAVRWSIELSRAGDTTEGRPTVPLHARPSYDISRRLDQATPWESRFVDLVRDDDSAVLFDHDDPNHTTAKMCTFGERAEALIDAQQAYVGSWYLPNLSSTTWSGDGPFDDAFSEALSNNSIVTDGADIVYTGGAPESNLEGIPCAFENPQVDLFFFFDPSGARDSSVGTGQDQDWCQTLQRATGCEVASIDQGISKRTLLKSTPTSSGVSYTSGHIDFSADITKVCRVPTVPETCAEQLSCLSPPDTPSFQGFDDATFGAQTLTNTGDLLCADADRSATFPVDYLAAANGGGQSMTRSQTLSNCLVELAALEDAPPSVTSTGGAGFRQLYPSAECVQVGRLLTGLAVQSRIFRTPSDAPKLPAADQAYASAYMNRLVGRWLQQNAFVASEAVQIHPMAALFDPLANSSTAALVPPPLQDVFEVSVGGLDVLLAPHVIDALLQTPAEALARPDYRALRFDGQPFEGDEPRQALATVIAQTLTQQASLAEAIVRDRAASASVVQPEDFAQFVPRLIVSQALAADLFGRAHDQQAPPAWADTYRDASRRLDAAVADMLDQARTIRAGGNVLGISDDDLPLYFRADQSDGPGDRFAAVSDYLIGSQPNQTAWAPAMVARAQESVEDARRALLALQERQIRRARSERDHSRWVENIRNDYNAKLRDYCGSTDHSWVDDPNFMATKCAIRAESPECAVDFSSWFASWTQSDLQGRFCMMQELENSALNPHVSAMSEPIRQFAQSCEGADGSGMGTMSIRRCSSDLSRSCLRCDSNRNVEPVVLAQNSLMLRAPNANDGSRAWSRAVETCTSRYPGMRLQVPLESNPFDQPECLIGSIGDAYLDVVSAQQDIEQARSERNEHQEAYRIAMESCLHLAASNDAIQQARQDHADNMRRLRRDKYIADQNAGLARSLKECFATMSGVDATTPWGAAIGGTGAAASCAAGIAELIYDLESRQLEDDIANAQTAHDNEVAKLQASGEERRCFNDAKQELVGLQTANLAIEQGLFDLRRAQQNVVPTIDEAQSLQEDGYAYLRQVESTRLPEASGDLWADPVVNEFIRDFTLAKRATYLGVRAVEYEFQQTLDARREVLAAETPEKLTSVLQRLWASAGTRSIRGNRPTGLISVISLRDDVLQLSDESGLPPGFHGLSPTERFRILLSDQRYADYDDQGRYLGQRIPFSLAPLGRIGLGDSDVPVFAANDCAERLWSINAAVLGDDVYQGSDTTVVRMDVLKRNSFYSQWCAEPDADQSPYQVASVRPARNLFRQPGLGAVDGTEGLGDNSQVDAFSRARIQAYINVTRGQLEDEQYANGRTTELGARGLYGDYALFIPAEMISRNGSSGLALDKVDDILVRLDYVSVAAW